MDSALLFLLIRLILAGVFALAGIAKLADLAGSRQAMHDFGLPAALAGPLGLLLPLAELAVALALLPAATAWWAAWGGLILLLGFIGGIAANLARGRTPNCHCFGQLHSKPIGGPTLLRNSLLALLAGALVWQGPAGSGPSALSWLAALSPLGILTLAGGLLLAAAIAVQTWIVLNLLRQNGRLLLRIEALEAHLGLAAPSAQPGTPAKGLPVGATAPAFRLPALAGGEETLETLRARGKPVLLIFSSPTCGPCLELLPEIARWQRAGTATVALISRGGRAAIQSLAAEHHLADVLLQQENEVGMTYGVTGTPSAVLITSGGAIAGPLAEGAPAVRSLAARALQPVAPPTAPADIAERMRGHLRPRAPIALNNDPAPKPLPAPGEPAPPVRLPDLEGQPVDLSSFRGKPLLLIFWNPGCGFCRRMADQLRAAVTHPAPGAPQVVLISTGTVEANRELALPAPTLLDEGFRTGFAFGARGTPSAIQVDAEGRIAGPVVVGAPDVLALIQRTPALA
ncbi:MAG TPA: TlpA disulfide reductase family protein [Caldilineaceae bacterium]|nr:TlpA disulfide reductase family protein [Caldilineaceae bacterium]